MTLFYRGVRQQRTRWGAFVAAALTSCALLLTSCRPGRNQEAPPPPAGPLRIVTYNVHAENGSFGETADVIRKIDADIVCLQEVSVAMAESLRVALGDPLPHQLFRDDKNGFGGLAFLSKYPLAAEAYLAPPDGGWFPAWRIGAQTPYGDLQIVNVHLRPSSSKIIRDALLGRFDLGAIHRAEIESYAAGVDSQRPALVLGDFNEGEDGAAVRAMLERGFVSALSQHDRRTGTCRVPVGRLEVSVRIDHILHSAHWHCTAARVIAGGASDHSPVVVELVAAPR